MANICMDCKKACGGCSWSELDPVTHKPKFEPVPGWTATPNVLQYYEKKGKKRFMESYDVKACPLFEPEEKRKTINVFLTPETRRCKKCGKVLEAGKGRIKYCFSCVPPGYVVNMGKVRKKSRCRK